MTVGVKGEFTPLCLVPRGKTLATAKPCGKFALRIVTIGCRHEHMATKVVCDEHADMLLRQRDKGAVLCQHCTKIDGHRCVLIAKEER